MGWGGAWRQEELKRFSSWVTTKVGLSQLGPWSGGRGGTGCNVFFCRWGQPCLCLDLHTAGSAQRSDFGGLDGPFINLLPPQQELD